jgi:hypothetical protein
MSAKHLKLALVAALAVIVYLWMHKKECPQQTQVTSTFIPGDVVLGVLD